MTLDLVIQIASWACFSIGGTFLVIGALGLIRLPDFWARIHAAGMIDTLGSALVLAGMMLQAGLTLTTLKLVLIGLFLFVAGPTASHAIANAAWVAGLKPERLEKDEGALLGRKSS
ncbi:MAG: monovalent cation/H(+) antiporter subunit G [Parvibaculum sp.]|nr:monovalent cation/H(+) antiporter subunit G [Parvibaculum sp.]|tara:strand:+ start:744 stop:1091 length:348 start_codon:yes stop_codon:yes gene_type:complete